MVSLQDLEELERLQLTAEPDLTIRPRTAFPLSAVFGVLLALVLVSVLAVIYITHEHSPAQAVQSRSH